MFRPTSGLSSETGRLHTPAQRLASPCLAYFQPLEPTGPLLNGWIYAYSRATVRGETTLLVLVLSDLWAEVPRKRKRRQPSILRYTLWHRSQSLASMAPLSLFIGGFISSMLSVIFIDRHQPPLAACICMNLISFLLLILHEYCHSIFKSARTTPLYARVSERLTHNFHLFQPRLGLWDFPDMVIPS